MPKIPQTKILIAAPLDLCREGIEALINKIENTNVCTSIATTKEALMKIETELPDMLITEINLADRSGIELIKDVRSLYPSLKTLVLSSKDENIYAERALRAGAKGFSSKSISFIELQKAIHCIINGQIYVSPAMSTCLIQQLTKDQTTDQGSSLLNLLSDRELQVFELIGQALSNLAIAEQLSITTRTVDTHKARIKEKLNLLDNNHLMKHAIQWNME